MWKNRRWLAANDQHVISANMFQGKKGKKGKREECIKLDPIFIQLKFKKLRHILIPEVKNLVGTSSLVWTSYELKINTEVSIAALATFAAKS